MPALAYAAAKRSLDAVLAGALLAVVAPLALVALVPLRGWRPRIAGTPCAGRRGRRFILRVEATDPPRSAFTWLIASCGLARWPVLLSVIAGDVSFVGPRILTATEAGALAPDERERFAVRPGLYCYWWLQQRANIDFGTEAEADARYLRERSLGTDASILLRSLVAMPYGRPDGTRRAVEHIAGIRLVNLGMDELVDAIMTAVEKRATTRIAFVNPDCVNIAARDPMYRALLAGSDWVCPDGIGMKIAGRILSRPIRQNLNGTDLFPRLCAALAAGGRSLYLLGARPGVAEAAARWAAQRYPQLRVAGCRSGYFSRDEEAEVVDAIRRSRADVLLVAMGVPLQEMWLKRCLKKSGAVVGIGVGGLFDFYGGRIPRAPLWLREIGGEWVYRLWQEPRRMWRRYLIGNAAFLWRVAKERIDTSAAAGSPR
jgi:N-acetylglucosaminyldiphosphoundecaprenol N-acetyl-beta-D-mannosaminyltransferase